ncbi:hypothetical protein V6C03_12875 [Methyloligella sp. 2.7D]|uniref:hypothetical protein n=1 Tax=unclassified Methyloligella TaxID=2625955 RepID=UPI00157CB369|nr:hypothetical protein [Methyloligella sp. GL2]QKP77325.1 hypothetical protein HT051_07585 [Methyloligella sp. GL2]
MRLPLLAIATLFAFALFRSATVDARPMWLPEVENPYCDIATFVAPNVPEQAVSLAGDDGKGMIVVSARTLSQSPEYGHFLMAHECCHHTLGHVRMFNQELGQMGPQPFFYIKPALRSMELDADCCAVKMLKATHEPMSIVAGEAVMSKFGDRPTGAYYPTGTERAANISACEARD